MDKSGVAEWGRKKRLCWQEFLPSLLAHILHTLTRSPPNPECQRTLAVDPSYRIGCGTFSYVHFAHRLYIYIRTPNGLVQLSHFLEPLLKMFCLSIYRTSTHTKSLQISARVHTAPKLIHTTVT